MKTKQYVLLLIALLGFSLIFFSCAASTQDNSGFEDELFGEEELEDIDGNVLSDLDASSDEDEILKLLGISDADSESQQMTQNEYASNQSTSTATAPGEGANLQDKVSYLEEEAQRKDIEISNLKAENAERERRLQDLQNRLSQQPSQQASGSASGSFKARYEEALGNYRSRNYRTAIQQFDALLAENTSNTLMDNCQYWKGECYYAMSDYNQAILEFQKVFTFGNSNKLDDAQLKLGLCYLRLENRDRARSEFEKLISNYPDSEFVSRAQSYMSRL